MPRAFLVEVANSAIIMTHGGRDNAPELKWKKAWGSRIKLFLTINGILYLPQSAQIIKYFGIPKGIYGRLERENQPPWLDSALRKFRQLLLSHLNEKGIIPSDKIFSIGRISLQGACL